jgi:hypothetical protein
MAIQTRNLRTDVDHQLQLLCADIADIRQFLEESDNTTTAELRSWHSEWPDVIARLERMVRARDAGDFTDEQSQSLDSVLSSVEFVKSDLLRAGLSIPST